MFRRAMSRLPRPIKRQLWLTRLFLRSLTGPWRMLPAFLIIGAQKGGTTSLYNYLIQHPHIAPALEKELRFFDYKFHKGLAWYQAHFPLTAYARFVQQVYQRALITGEASPNYLFDPRAPQRVAHTLPDVKLIVLLRNPIDRAYSNYQMCVKTGLETLSFVDAVAAEPARIEGELHRMMKDERLIGSKRHDYSYLARGIYLDQLEPWLTLFPRRQFLFVKSEAFFADPPKIFEQAIRFLNLPAWELKQFKVYNAGGGFPGMDWEMRVRLGDYFAPHNRRLYKRLAVNFGWEEET